MKKEKAPNSARVPIYREAGFELYDAERTARAFNDEKDSPANPDLYIYSRYRNPTVVEAERRISGIEGSSWSLLTQSGMSALDTALSVFQHGSETAPWLFFTEIYGGTNSFIDSVLVERRGIDVVRFSPVEERYSMSELRKVVRNVRPAVIFMEVISNPLLVVADPAGVAKIAGEVGARLIVDNTFATPYLCRPLELGADLVVHSATKYLGGHGNITAGAICGNDENLRRELTDYRKFTGHMLSADDAYRLTTQMESFHLRVAKQFDNAAAIARLLEESVAVERVIYPSLKSHPTADIADSLFGRRGYGAIVTFDMAGATPRDKRHNRDRFIENVYPSIRLIPTLGDSHSILLPVEPVWGYKYDEPGMIRLSVGFEQTELLTGVIAGALSKL